MGEGGCGRERGRGLGGCGWVDVGGCRCARVKRSGGVKTETRMEMKEGG